VRLVFVVIFRRVHLSAVILLYRDHGYCDISYVKLIMAANGEKLCPHVTFMDSWRNEIMLLLLLLLYYINLTHYSLKCV
jgi:hypothetical protein